ncbi:hypothetical protein RCL_jg16361.t2 [Rhizophagus clarus]|uniref:Uncharacterized protein n=1 Tax=Rhizophagus clarus TaxID=94130 RepID=A0A8H3LZZ1_9GLOM|nr:hypothetical protein RCL_jg16361.t2 [Rhizophagus clarus]
MKLGYCLSSANWMADCGGEKIRYPSVVIISRYKIYILCLSMSLTRYILNDFHEKAELELKSCLWKLEIVLLTL